MITMESSRLCFLREAWFSLKQLAPSKYSMCGVAMLPLIVISLALVAVCPEEGTSNMAAEFYIAPQGRDTNAGTKDAPFRTLRRARSAVRFLKQRHGLPTGGVTVWLRGGIYERDHTFELTEEDSGTEAGPIVYRAQPSEEGRSASVVLKRQCSNFTPACLCRWL